jgi:hypothetical protein
MTADPLNHDPNPSLGPSPNPSIVATIDAALRSVGSATPASGLEGRILTRLASERLKIEAEPASSRFRWLPARALGLVTACLLGFVVVASSVSHSRRIRPQLVAPPSLVLPGQGIGAASAVHPAAPTAVPAGQAGRSARSSGPGRARIAPHTRKAPGVAVPAPPTKTAPSDSQN